MYKELSPAMLAMLKAVDRAQTQIHGPKSGEGACPECKGKKWVPETFRNQAGYQDHERITCPACKGTGKASGEVKE